MNFTSLNINISQANIGQALMAELFLFRLSLFSCRSFVSSKLEVFKYVECKRERKKEGIRSSIALSNSSIQVRKKSCHKSSASWTQWLKLSNCGEEEKSTQKANLYHLFHFIPPADRLQKDSQEVKSILLFPHSKLQQQRKHTSRQHKKSPPQSN